MAHHFGSFTQRALASVVALSLVTGLSPMTAYALDPAQSSTTNGSATTNGSTTNGSAADATTNTTGGSSSSGTGGAGGAGTTNPTNPTSPTTDNSSAGTTPASSADEEATEDDPYASTYSASNADTGESTGSITYITGDTTAQAAVNQAMAGWDHADTVILVSTSAGTEILCAAALAGAFDCPILCFDDNGLDEATTDAIKNLGASRVVLITTKESSIDETKAALESIGAEEDSDVAPLQDITVIQGYDATAVSLSVARYGDDIGLWKSTSMTLANGADLEVARATTDFAFRMAQPVLLTAADGKLSAPENLYFSRAKESLASTTKTTLYLLATNGRVDSAADSLRVLNADARTVCKIISLEGDDVYAVNEHAQNWYAAKRKDVDWSGSIIANPAQTSCATAGVLAAKLGVAHLACPEEDVSASALIPSTVGATNLTVSGEGTVLKDWVVNTIRARSGIIEVSTVAAGISIDDAANREVDYAMDSEGNPTKSKDDILESMDPSQGSYGTDTYYQFAVLSDGYSGAITAEQLDAFIDANCGPSEASAGTTSLLRGQGQAFIDAAKESGVNEVYLLAHAIIESAYGTSPLSRGTITGANNFFGIAAFDSNPNAAASYAANQGWYTPEDGIKGGAAWIAEHYIHAESAQDTIYRMRFNLPSGGNQYATSLTWPHSIAKLMSRIYASAGVDLVHTGLNFKVTTY